MCGNENNFAWGFTACCEHMVDPRLIKVQFFIMDKETNIYRPSDRLRDVIDENNLLLLVISRFSIPFGFGDNTIREVCRENGVDCPTFLAVANFICGKEYRMYDVALTSLMGYLRKAHAYFLDFILPSIRRKLIEAINCSDINDVAFLILKYFDDYVEEVRRHMNHEDTIVFSYVSDLQRGVKADDFNISDYSASHEDMADRLNELKDIVIRHYRQNDNDLLNSVLYDIIGCQNDLVSHCSVENSLLVPAVARLERAVAAKASLVTREISAESEGETPHDNLSEREKEIVRCVARGMANKEIADKLCLSIHTVTTYRRNIASKLQIHSPAGLTIFAIIHKLIDIAEIKLQ